MSLNSRARLLSSTKVTNFKSGSKCVVYWMHRDHRVDSNWAMLYAQEVSRKYRVPMHVHYHLWPSDMGETRRQRNFMFDGLKEVEGELRSKGVSMTASAGEGTCDIVTQQLRSLGAGLLVVDQDPTRQARQYHKLVAEEMERQGIPTYQIEAMNIVPVWLASSKQEVGARTLRPKLWNVSKEYLTPVPKFTCDKDDKSSVGNFNPIDWETIDKTVAVDEKVLPVQGLNGGRSYGLQVLHSFCTAERLKLYETVRNNPVNNAQSQLSTYFRFGQVGPQEAVYLVHSTFGPQNEGAKSFVEEAWVRRELSDNFVYYQPNYDNIEGAAGWAHETLDVHVKDKRSYLYTDQQFELGLTHDPLWNAAQKQLLQEGKLHGFLRMYWAKKILEWSPTAEEALRVAIWLNDKFAIDGRCPNGFVGIMWSICGTHDMGWTERPIFGKIRFMNYDGCRRKFNVDEFVRKYGLETGDAGKKGKRTRSSTK